MNSLKLVKGNDFTTIIEVKAYKYNGEEITDFDLGQCTDIKVRYKVESSTKDITDFEVLENNKLQIAWDGPSLSLGKYTLEVIGKLNGLDWRFYDKEPIFTIVNTNSEAVIPQNSIVREDVYSIDKSAVYVIYPKGDTGPRGPMGPRGRQGEPGPAGENGKDG